MGRVRNRLKPIARGSPKEIVAHPTRPTAPFEITPDGDGLAGLGKRPGLAIGEHHGERQASTPNPNTTMVATFDGKLVFARRRDRQLRDDILSQLIQARVGPDLNATLAVH